MSFINIYSYLIEGSNILGTTMRVTIVVSVDTLTTATITIEDSSNIEKVTNATMTRETTGIYTYSYSSDIDDLDGTYIARVTLVSGTDTTIEELAFNMVDQSDQ